MQHDPREDQHEPARDRGARASIDRHRRSMPKMALWGLASRGWAASSAQPMHALDAGDAIFHCFSNAMVRRGTRGIASLSAAERSSRLEKNRRIAPEPSPNAASPTPDCNPPPSPPSSKSAPLGGRPTAASAPQAFLLPTRSMKRPVRSSPCSSTRAARSTTTRCSRMARRESARRPSFLDNG
jgi:hypothetical protein